MLNWLRHFFQIGTKDEIPYYQFPPEPRRPYHPITPEEFGELHGSCAICGNTRVNAIYHPESGRRCNITLQKHLHYFCSCGYEFTGKTLDEILKEARAENDRRMNHYNAAMREWVAECRTIQGLPPLPEEGPANA